MKITDKMRNKMEEQELASHHILESLSNMKTQASDVNDKSIELKAGIENVQRDMDSVSQISQTILGSMDEMAVGAKKINDTGSALSNIAGKMRDSIDEIGEQVDKFKV